MAIYLLFRGDTFYPSGGVGDLEGVYATYEQAQAARFDSKISHVGDWTQIACVDDDRVEVVDVWRQDEDAPHASLKGRVLTVRK